MNDVLQEFLNKNIRIAWKTQYELETMADIIDQMTGQKYDRRYMRGYTPREYGYWGMSDLTNEVLYCVWGSRAAYTYTPDEFIALLGDQDESTVDISALL